MQKKKGISLIVLVITIIVMIILAATIILSLNNAGIIGNANKAVSETDYKNVQTAAQLVYADMMLSETEKPSMMLKQGEYIKQKLISQGTITADQSEMYRFKNNGEVVKLQTKSEYETMYAQELAMLDSSYYTITDGKFTLTTAGKKAAKDGTLTKLVIPYGTTIINSTAADYCVSLTEIIMPDTVTDIYYWAFNNCSNLERVTFSKSLKMVSEEAFKGTKWLSNSENSAQAGLVIEEGVLISGIKSQGKVIIPNTVEVIADKAFFIDNWPNPGKTDLIGVVFPNTIEVISYKAFAECTEIQEIVFEGQLPKLDYGSFGCLSGNAPVFQNNLKLYQLIYDKYEDVFMPGD